MGNILLVFLTLQWILICLKGCINSWIKAGATTDNIIERLRLETVPAVGYKFHTWTEGTYPLLCIV